MGTTTDPRDPDIGHGVDTEPIDQHPKYLVLSDDERSKGFVRPVRRSYVHVRGGERACHTVTRMADAIAETYAREPTFYGATYCVGCRMHLPVGPEGEFDWLDDGTPVGS